MKTIQKFIAAPILKRGYKKIVSSEPKVIKLTEKVCIGYTITTSLKGNQKKEDIPPFFHDIYDNDKLRPFWSAKQRNMYCIFNMHKNGQDFDYSIATENNQNLHGEEQRQIIIPGGKYVSVEFLKQNHTAVSRVLIYLRAIWLEANGYKAKNSAAFILYDERFHKNYQQYGCVNGNYLGNPVATYFIPIEN